MLTKIGIIGSRLRNSPEDKVVLLSKLKMEIIPLYGGHDNVIFLSGGCKTGGDHFAEEIALEEYGQEFRDKMIIHYPNKKDLDKVLLKTNPSWAWAKINYARNTLVARDSDILVALLYFEDKGGTMNTVNTFKEIKVWKNRLFLNTRDLTWRT